MPGTAGLPKQEKFCGPVVHTHHGLFFAGGKKNENIFSGNDGDHIRFGSGSSILIVYHRKDACGYGTKCLSEAAQRPVGVG